MAGAATVVEVLGTIEDPAVRFDFIWMSIGGATEADAREVMPTGPEPRARSWWDGPGLSSQEIGFDQVLLYEAGRTWPEGALGPGPADLSIHESALDPDALRKAMEQRLPDCASVETR